MGGWTHGYKIDFIRNEFLKVDLLLLENEYHNNKIKMKCECKLCGKISHKTYSAIKLGYACSCKSKSKRERTNLKRYGIKAISQLDETKLKIEKTNLKKYGCKAPLQNNNIKEKTKLTNLVRYGVENVFASDAIKEKIKKTSIRKYGVEYPMQNTLVANKQLQSCYKNKTFVFPSGREEICQGYEPQVIEKLLNDGISEDDIVININEMPEIWYYDKGIKRRYYPDLFIKSKNQIIEVKSQYTYNVSKRVNLLKKDACLVEGYNFKFIIL